MDSKQIKVNPICKEKGHDWIEYTVGVGLKHWSTDIEQAGYCERCGEDTHGEYLEQLNAEKK